MPILYNISFRTKKLARKFDSKGNLISEAGVSDPIKITMLPYATAMKYSGNTDFKMERYIPEPRRELKRQGSKHIATEKSFEDHAIEEMQDDIGSNVPTDIKSAAQTGDMSGAINV